MTIAAPGLDPDRMDLAPVNPGLNKVGGRGMAGAAGRAGLIGGRSRPPPRL
jgi:hypothetical protein